MLTLIETGRIDETLEARFGDYVDMFDRLLGPHGIETQVVRLVRGENLPDPATVKAVLITGSRHGVYDDIAWIPMLKDFIRAVASRRVPMVGICFGHQIIAEALGGKVVKSEKGWGLGPMEYALSPVDNLPEMPAQMRVQAIHQDQIIIKPDDAEVFAASDFCQFAGLVYGGEHPYAVTLQAHPEFDADFVGTIVEARRGNAYPEDRASAALAKIDAPLDSPAWGEWIAQFLKTRSA